METISSSETLKATVNGLTVIAEVNNNKPDRNIIEANGGQVGNVNTGVYTEEGTRVAVFTLYQSNMLNVSFDSTSDRAAVLTAIETFINEATEVVK